MQNVRISYKNDDYGSPMYCRVTWAEILFNVPRPIALIYHGGSLIVGSSDIIPQSQINYLTSQGFVVVAPNYRLAPQVTAGTSIQDSEEAFDWSVSTLPTILQSQHNLAIDPERVVTMGHSTGGTVALHVAAHRPVRATTALYPSLFVADPTNPLHHPSLAPPFNSMPDFHPSAEDWASITPPDRQVSEAGLATPGSVPAARNRWQADLIKHGQVMRTLCPDGAYAVIDPLVAVDGAAWPPTMIVQGDADVVPGSSIELARRAEAALQEAGVEVRLEVVPGAPHMFDLPPSVGTTDKGEKWEAVVKGMEWLRARISERMAVP